MERVFELVAADHVQGLIERGGVDGDDFGRFQRLLTQFYIPRPFDVARPNVSISLQGCIVIFFASSYLIT